MAGKNGHVKGFRVTAQPARLVFDGDYEGLEVVCRLNVPVEMYLEFAKIATLGEVEGQDQLQGMAHYFSRFSDSVLLDWNLEDDDGNPVPVRPDGMLRIPVEMATVIMVEWMGALNNRAPLVQRISDSSTSSASGGGKSPRRSSRSLRT